MNCTICENKIKEEYFDGVNGKICADCLKKMMVYYGLKTINLIKKEV